MRDSRHVRLHPGLLAEQRLGPLGSLTVLIVVPLDSSPDRVSNLEAACADASEGSSERMLALWAHDVEPARLHEVIGRRVHVAVVVVSNDELANRAVRLLQDAGLPHLLLVTATTAEQIGALLLPGADGEIVAPRTPEEARASVAAFLLRVAADGDDLRRRCRPLLYDGPNASRQRALRGWVTLPQATQGVIAACNGFRASEVHQLLQDSHATHSPDVLRIAQLDIDIRQAVHDLGQAVNVISALEDTEHKAFAEFCQRQGLHRDSELARRLLSVGETRARERAHSIETTAGAARRSFRYWTAWAALWDAM